MPSVSWQAFGTPKLIIRLAALLEETCHTPADIASCAPAVRLTGYDGPTLRPLDPKPRYVAIAVQTDGYQATVLLRIMDEPEAREVHALLEVELPQLWHQAGAPKRQVEVDRRPVFYPLTVELTDRWNQVFQRARQLDDGQGVPGLSQKLASEFGDYAGDIYTVMIHRRLFIRVGAVTYVNPNVSIKLIPTVDPDIKGHRRYRSKGYQTPAPPAPILDSDP